MLDLDPMRYHLVRSTDFAAFADDQVARAPRVRVRRVEAHVESVTQHGMTTTVTWGGGQATAALVLDSRPCAPTRAPTVWWWQHFRGWLLPAGAVEGTPASLMDFRTPQPHAGLSFGYLLPLPDGRALAEYTEFSPTRLEESAYDDKVRVYLDLLGVDPNVEPEHVETGAIPMTNAVFARRPSSRVLRIGTAGGATRGSTGYTFSAMLRDGHAIAQWVAGGGLAGDESIEIPAPYPTRHRWLDSVQLQALAHQRVNGPDFFTGLFAAQPAPRVLRFLDGASTLAEDAAVIASAPIVPMILAAFDDTAARVRSAARSLPVGAGDLDHVVPVKPTPGHSSDS